MKAPKTPLDFPSVSKPGHQQVQNSKLFCSALWQSETRGWQVRQASGYLLESSKHSKHVYRSMQPESGIQPVSYAAEPAMKPGTFNLSVKRSSYNCISFSKSTKRITSPEKQNTREKPEWLMKTRTSSCRGTRIHACEMPAHKCTYSCRSQMDRLASDSSIVDKAEDT